jgi:MFS-type transporter involved in bile tolerance (Atg22 family)
MPAESTATNMRASVMGVMSLLLSAGMAISIVLFALGVNLVGSKHIGMLSIAICIPLMILSCILLSRVKETKGNDLDEI